MSLTKGRKIIIHINMLTYYSKRINSPISFTFSSTIYFSSHCIRRVTNPKETHLTDKVGFYSCLLSNTTFLPDSFTYLTQCSVSGVVFLPSPLPSLPHSINAGNRFKSSKLRLEFNINFLYQVHLHPYRQ